MPEELPNPEKSHDPYLKLALRFATEVPELEVMDERELDDLLTTVAMILEDTKNQLIGQQVGCPNIMSKISVSMPNEDERMIVVGGKRLDDGIELPIRWVSDPETIRNLKKYQKQASE